MTTTTDLLKQHCGPISEGTPAIGPEEAKALLAALNGWSLLEGETAIKRTFTFENYYATMAFVNAVAWVAHREDHHPDLAVSYNRCAVRFSTHTVGGLSRNDFICAAKIDALQ